jgi:hypothetical protein
MVKRSGTWAGRSRSRVSEDRLATFGFKIARPDVADFMVRAAENHASIDRVIGISN